MKIIRKLMSIVTAAVCSAGIFAGTCVFTVGAEVGTYGDLSYTKADEDSDGTYDYVEITDCDESAAEIEIPAAIDGLPVKKIGYCAFRKCESLTGISIPDTVISIGNYAFWGCEALTDISFPDSIATIGNFAFSYCISLTGITIPDSVTEIGEGAFCDCTSLKDVTLSKNIKSLYTKLPQEYPVYNAGGIFQLCTSLESITIPANVEIIGNLSFYGCSNLKSITIENPECAISDDEKTIMNGYDDNETPYFSGTIFGCENSTAQAYAERYGYDFAVIGSYTESDAVNLQNYLAGSEKLTEAEFEKYDLNGDSVLNVFDMIMLKRRIME